VISKRDNPRRVVPRWRSPADALAANEGRAITRSAPPLPPLRPDIVSREAEWLRSQERGVALDLVSLASTSPDPSPVAQDAARWLMNQGHLTALARRAVERVLNPIQLVEEAATEQRPDEDSSRIATERRLRHLKAALTAEPRDAVAWAERARMYALLGQKLPAVAAMRRALALAPNHRYFLRAAARLWLHYDDPERARATLIGSRRTPNDPWLLASEIAVNSVMDRRSPLVRGAELGLVRGRWAPADLTELHSALGTVELETGKSRRARDLFRESLRGANDNSLAQAEWASPHVKGVEAALESALEEVPKSFEARSIAAVNERHHAEAVSQAWFWLLDQPFSSEAAVFGSYQAALIQDFARSLAFAERGLQANPQLPILLNNAAFALAKQNEVERAQALLDRIPAAALEDPDEAAVISATQGLIAFRAGDVDAGERHYAEALAKMSSETSKALAMLMFVVEMLRVRLPGAAEAAEAALTSELTKLDPKDRGWADHVRAELRPRQTDH
jgi:tetratricopeptide (TPR) repeat protein